MGGSQPTIPAQRCARAAAATCRIQSQSSLALSRSTCWERMRRMACSAPVVHEVCTMVTLLQVYVHPSYTHWQLARPPCSRTGPTHSCHARLNCWIPAPAKQSMRWQHGGQIAQGPWHLGTRSSFRTAIRRQRGLHVGALPGEGLRSRTARSSWRRPLGSRSAASPHE